MEKIVYPDGVRPESGSGRAVESRYDLVVVGGGAAGLAAAVGGARLGARVALVERGLLGGEKLNVGCVPSKAFVASARRAADVRAAESLGVFVPGPARIRFDRVLQRMRDLRAMIGGESSSLRLVSEGVTVVPGEAVFDSPRSVVVDGRRLEFTRAVIATGASPRVPDIPGLDGVPYLTDESLFDMEDLPRTMIVMGGGPMGCEMAQAFQRLGVQVTMLQTHRCLRLGGDPRASGVVRRALEADGVDVRLDVRPLEVRLDESYVVSYDGGGGRDQVRGDALLIAAGRRPRVENLGLDRAGVDVGPSGLAVDPGLRTTNPRIYGAGDVCLSPCSTHGAILSARVCLRNAFFPGVRRFNNLHVPGCTYTDPEVAWVGETLDQVRQRGGRAVEIKVELEDMDRSLLDGGGKGFLNVVVGRRGRILGATLVGRRAGDLICQAAMAMSEGISLRKLSWVAHPYPTEAAVFRRAADVWNERRLTPLVRVASQLWMAILSKMKDAAQREEARSRNQAAGSSIQQEGTDDDGLL